VHDNSFQGGDDGRGYRNRYVQNTWGSEMDLGH
jgi:hypothetical protein